jgi:antitoxin MazE
MMSTIHKWGNSNALRIPKSILDTAAIKENDRVELSAARDTITIQKASRKYKSLDELFAGYVGGKSTEDGQGSALWNEVF